MRVFLSSVLTALVLVPSVAFALTIAPADYYKDVRSSSPEAVGINLLTREGVVKGYGNGIFGTARLINRAEFLKLVMIVGEEAEVSTTTCFPDVHSSDWFRPFVCAAKELGIVSGKVPSGLFDPSGIVTYGEALKMLATVFYCRQDAGCRYPAPSSSNQHWAEPYYRSAVSNGTDLPMRITLDTPLTRGRAARLVAAFLAEFKGRLEDFRRAEQGEYGVSSSASSSLSSSTSSSSSRMSSMSSSVSVRPLDPIADKTIRSQFLLLGETGPVIGAVKIFIEAEPLDVTSISVNLSTESRSVQHLVVYDDQSRLLGKALYDPSTGSNKKYTLFLTPGSLTIEKRTDLAVYVRPVLASKDGSGVSNEPVSISNIVVIGNGVWSSQKYTKASTETFQNFVTSRSTITKIENALQASAPLVTGAGMRIGSFTFTGRKTDASAHIDITALRFQVGITGDLTLTNVKLRSDGVTDPFSCTSSSVEILCSGIPDMLGSIADEPRTLTLYGDISGGDPVHASLQVSLNQTGSPSNAGSVTWSDGTNSFSWLGFDAPAVVGTRYSY
jgi:hypothetical protein